MHLHRALRQFFHPPEDRRRGRRRFRQKDIDLLLRNRGIDLAGSNAFPARRSSGPGVYSPDMNDRETLATELNVFADFNPKLPESYKTSPYLLLGNIQPALQRSVKSQMNGRRAW
jgi:hypothetical protein